jgi:23S rRNA (cytidine1920-2'-O)/16S rRNA (cytidine1409-2'-O)-methyltransferase
MTKKAEKIRLDAAVAQQYPEYSRTQIQSWIMQGKVQINNTPVTKPGTLVDPTAPIMLTIEEPKFVCRAGAKLEHALNYFNISVKGLTVLDAGISTGGFTDCLLQRGAHKVYGVDVGYGQVHEKIRQDQRVVLHEKTNLRHLTDIGEKVDLITLDLSFISLLKVMDAVVSLLKPTGSLITLIKPQFEAAQHLVGRGGIITDPKVHKIVLDQVIAGIELYGFTCQGVIESPILGKTGNKEFLAYFKRRPE